MKYNLIGEDEKVFKIKHPDGSEFHISKKSISPALHVKIKALKMADGGEVPDPSESEPSQALMVEPATEQEVQAVPEPKPLMIEPASDEEVSSTPVRAPAVAKTDQAPINQGVPTKALETDEQAPIKDAVLSAAEKSYKERASGIAGMAQAQATEEKEKAAAYQDQVAQTTKIIADAQAEQAKIKAKRAQLYNDVYNAKIDPSRYLSNMSTGNKILAAISVFMGGLGAGIQGHGAPNAALGIIRDSIQNDIEAQKAELGKKQNLLSKNLQEYGDLNAATQATLAELNVATQAKVAQAAAKAGSPEAIYRAKMLNGELLKDQALLDRNLTILKLVMGAGNQDPDKTISYLRAVAPEQAKEIEARYIPGVGIGSVPIPEKPRSEIIARQTLQEQVHKLRSWAQEHSGSLSLDEINYGKALANAVQDSYRRANGQGVFREAEAKFVEGVVDKDPSKFLNEYRTDPKYKALEDSNLVELNGIKKSYGLPQATQSAVLAPKEQEYYKWAKANPSDPRSAAVLKRLGMQ